MTKQNEAQQTPKATQGAGLSSLFRTKWFAPLMGGGIAAIAFLIMMWLAQADVQAAPQHGFGWGDGRSAPIGENDFHTSAWDRFGFNYHFTSGSDHRFELGRPSTFSGFVPADVFSVNMRRDAQVSLWPPSYGIFSGRIPTPPVNRLFPQPINPHFHQLPHNQSSHQSTLNLLPHFDTLGHGVNAGHGVSDSGGGGGGGGQISNPMNIQNVGAGEFLPPTSIVN